MDRLEIERLGGLAGFGGAGSCLRSRGQLDATKLSAVDQKAVSTLFSQPVTVDSSVRDGFRYRITRHTDASSMTVEIPEQHVPDVLKASVRDEIV
jgi:hypothetical protein